MAADGNKKNSGGRAALLLVLRLLRLALAVFSALVVLVLLVGAVLWMAKSPLVASHLSRTLSQRLLDEGYTVRIADILGSPFGRLVLDDVWIGSAAGDTLFACEAIQLRYPLGSILRGHLGLDDLHLLHPRLALVEDPDGKIRVPWRQRAAGPPARGTGRFLIDRLSLHGLRISLREPGGTERALVDSLFLRGRLTVEEGAPQLVARWVAGQVPIVPLTVDSLACVATLREGRLFFGDIAVQLGASRLDGEGVISLSGPPLLAFDVQIPELQTVDAWRIRDLSGILGHGTLHGTAHVHRVEGAVHLEWDLAGSLSGDTIDRLAGSGTLNLETFRMASVELRSGRHHSWGSAQFELVPPRRYEADLTLRDVDLTDVPVHDTLVVLHPHRINGRISLRGDDYSRPFPKMDIRCELEPSTYAGVHLDSLFTFVSLIPGDVVRVHDSVAFFDGGSLRGKAEILPGRHVEADLRGEGLPIDRFAAMHGMNGGSGVVDFVAAIRGDPLHPGFEGAGRVSEFVLGSFRVPRCAVEHIRGGLAPFAASVVAEGEDGEIAGRGFSRARFTGVVGDTILIERLEVSAGDTTVAASGRLWSGGVGTEGWLDGLAVTHPIGTFTLLEPARVSLGAGGFAKVGPGKLRLADGGLEFVLETDPRGARAHLWLRGENLPVFDLVTLPWGDLQAEATADFVMDYLGDPEWPRLTAAADVRGLRLGAVEADSVRFAVAAAGDSVRVSGLEIAGPGGRVRLDAVLKGGDSPLKAVGTTRGLTCLAARERTLKADLAADSLQLGLARAVKSLLDAVGTETAAEADPAVPDEVFGEVPGLLETLDGRASTTLQVTGPLFEPEFHLEFRADSVEIRGQRVEALRLSAEYQDSLLTLSRCDIAAGGRPAEVTGFVPYRIDLAQGRFERTGREMAFSVDLTETPLALLSIFIPDLIVSGGRLSGRGEIRGSPSEPVLSGDFDLTDGKFRWAGRQESLSEARATIHLREQGILLTEFAARQERTGRLRCVGQLRSPTEYRFQVSLDNCRFYEGGMITGLVDGTLNVSPDSVTTDRVVPRVDGLVKLKLGEIFDWGAPRTERSQESPDVLYDLTVDVGRVYVRTTDVQTSTDFVIGDGQLTVRNYPEQIHLGGTLRILEGSWTVLNNRFQITHGELNFVEVEGINPELDIVAETPIRGPYARESESEVIDAKIILFITGTLRAPTFTWSTEPEMLALTQTEILSYLAYGRYTSAGGDQSGAPQWTAPTTDIIMNIFAQEIAGLLPGVDRIEVSTQEETPHVYVVKSLTDELTIGYTTGVSLSPDQALSVEARLSNIFVLKGSVIREQLGTTGEVGERYDLDFRLKFEY